MAAKSSGSLTSWLSSSSFESGLQTESKRSDYATGKIETCFPNNNKNHIHIVLRLKGFRPVELGTGSTFQSV
ncbi:hypothetical protein PR048_005864 [Dryococelus australis]|uniref:Uncharacterized protein n=1 Tax=Dryococelus australis TaxID=614101 RepID=A0ABQ9IBI9_9NEOP|nr:hypothetical protein PR048_005864 [Dryococelus australis]